MALGLDFLPPLTGCAVFVPLHVIPTGGLQWHRRQVRQLQVVSASHAGLLLPSTRHAGHASKQHLSESASHPEAFVAESLQCHTLQQPMSA